MIVSLHWEGGKAAQAVARALAEGHHVEIELPAGLHHALYRQLHPDAPRGSPEALDEPLDREDLSRLAALPGYADLVALLPLLERGCRARIASPDPFLYLQPSQRSKP